MLKRVFVFLLFLLLFSLGAVFNPQKVHAAVVTWDGEGADGTCGGGAGDGNKWSCALNWSGDTQPGSGDVATFDTTSTKNATIDAGFAGSVSGIDINTGYIGTITQARTLTIGSGNYNQADGTFTGSADAIDINNNYTLSNGVFTATSATMTIQNALTILGGTFTHNSGTITFDSFGTSANIACNNTTFNQVNISKSNSLFGVTVGSNCSLPLGNNPTSTGLITNNGTITIGGTTWTLNGSYISNSGAVLTMASGTTLDISEDLTLTTGTFPASITTISLGDDLDNTGNLLPNNIDITFDATGYATLACGTATFNSAAISKNAASYTITVESDCTLPLGNSPSSTGDITNNGTIIIGTGTWTHTGNYISNAGAVLTMTGNTIDINSGLLTLSGGTFPSNITTLSVNEDVDNSGNLLPDNIDLTLDGASSPNLDCGNASFKSINISKSASAYHLTPTSSCTTGNFTITEGFLDNPASAYSYFVSGNFSQSTNDTVGGANLTFEFNGSGAQAFSMTDGTFSPIFKVNKATGTLTLSTALTTTSQACNITEGLFDLDSQAFTCGSTFTVEDGGILVLQGAETPTTPTLDTGSTVKYKGNGDTSETTYTIKDWSYKNLTVNFTDTQDILDPGATATITVAENLVITSGKLTSPTTLNVTGDFTNNATFTHNSGTVVLNGTSQTIAGSTTFNNFTKNVTSTDTLTFIAGTTQTFVGTMDLQGAASNLLSLRSSSSPTQWEIDPQGTRTIGYLDVKDSNNINATTINVTGFNITDSGHNTGWIFNATPNIPTSLGSTAMVTGTTTTSQTPTLEFILSDSDSGDTVQYRIQIDNSSNFSSPVVDFTSSLQSPSFRTFTVGQSLSGGTYAVGGESQKLSNGNYYWRVRAIDNGASESSYATARSGNVAFIVDTNAPTGNDGGGTGSTDTTEPTPVITPSPTPTLLIYPVYPGVLEEKIVKTTPTSQPTPTPFGDGTEEIIEEDITKITDEIKKTITDTVQSIGKALGDAASAITKAITIVLGKRSETISQTILNLRKNELAVQTSETSTTLSATGIIIGTTALTVPVITSIATTTNTIFLTSGITASPGVQFFKPFVSVITGVGYSIVIMIQNFLVLLFGGALLRQQRKKTWGLVYNSVTKKPVSGAIVILFSKSGNLYTTFTNNEGRFGFLPEKGDTYQIRVEKSGYTFPSEVVLSNTDGYIKHVYQQSQTFIITEENPNIQVSLPLDPRLTAYLKTIARIKNVIGQFWDNLAVYLLLGFLVLSGFSMIINPNFLNSTLFAMYLLITAVNLKQRLERARTWGVVESSYGQRITNATIKLYRTTKHGDKDELYTTTSTNGRGRYQFVPEYGYYILEVKHPDIQKYQSLVSVSPNKPFINERIVLEPVKKQ